MKIYIYAKLDVQISASVKLNFVVTLDKTNLASTSEEWRFQQEIRKLPASDDDRLFAVPSRVVGHYFSVCSDVLRRELRQFIGLSVHPTKRLHLLQTAQATNE